MLAQREVLVAKQAACDPAQSEIERRRASLRSKLAGTLDDDILAPPLPLNMEAGASTAPDVMAKDLHKMLSPPKKAGKGSVVKDTYNTDDLSVPRFFGE